MGANDGVDGYRLYVRVRVFLRRIRPILACAARLPPRKFWNCCRCGRPSGRKASPSYRQRVFIGEVEIGKHRVAAVGRHFTRVSSPRSWQRYIWSECHRLPLLRVAPRLQDLQISGYPSIGALKDGYVFSPPPREVEMLVRRHRLATKINDLMLEPRAMDFANVSSRWRKSTPPISAPSEPARGTT